jgi:hypothetical protein
MSRTAVKGKRYLVKYGSDLQEEYKTSDMQFAISLCWKLHEDAMGFELFEVKENGDFHLLDTDETW